MLHKHKCGLWGGDEMGPIGLLLTPPSKRPKGCGFEWEHEDMDVHHVGEAVSTAAHTCPNCGRGPWELHCRPETLQAIETIDRKFHPQECSHEAAR